MLIYPRKLSVRLDRQRVVVIVDQFDKLRKIIEDEEIIKYSHTCQLRHDEDRKSGDGHVTASSSDGSCNACDRGQTSTERSKSLNRSCRPGGTHEAGAATGLGNEA